MRHLAEKVASLESLIIVACGALDSDVWITQVDKEIRNYSN
jgi:hypothetical protein